MRPSSPDAPAPRWRPAALAGKLLLAGAIIAFELIVLVWIARPKIDDAYRRHFVDRTSGCWAPADYLAAMSRRPQPRVINPARLDRASACIYLPDGWSLPEDNGIWTIGRHAVILAPAPPAGGRIRLWFVAPGYLPAPQQVVIRQGVTRVYAGRLAADKPGLADVIPDRSAADANGFVRLDLDIAHPMSPRASSWRRFDSRLLGLRLTRMAILAR
jgi:hypothetical protein